MYRQDPNKSTNAGVGSSGVASSGVLDVGTLLAITDHHHHDDNLAIDPAIGLTRNDVDEDDTQTGNDDLQHQRLRQVLQQHNEQSAAERHHASEFFVQDKHGETFEALAHSSMAGDSTATTATPPAGAPTVGPNGEPIDPKKTCPFCGRTFSHPGSLGRHLDLKRGTRLHPAPRVDMIRGDVKRRGDAVEIRARRARRAKMYNAREDVKQRARMRRKAKERSDRARDIARSRFIQRIGQPVLPPHPSFAYLVLYFLSPAQWPHDPPTKQTYEQVDRALGPLAAVDPECSTYRSKLEVAFEQWSVMNMQTKLDIWAREQRRAAEAALGTLTLYDLGARDAWLALEEDKIVRIMGEDRDEGKEEDVEERDRDINVESMAAAAFAAATEEYEGV